jgi:CheY-like chemotaxis protein
VFSVNWNTFNGERNEFKMEILVAEDDPVSALVIQELLEGLGHKVSVFEDGHEAWQALEKTYFPIVVLDWMMPRVDGIEVARRIRAHQKSESDSRYICIIMITAKTAREDRVRAIQSGVDVFLSKPLDTAAMTARLQVAERILNLES